jgi:tRNA nucleotidyltransferase (CCA-adding enzyme)
VEASLSSGARLPLSKDLRQFLQPILQKAQSADLPVYLVGGCVRDLVLGKEPIDVDVVVEGPADTFAKSAARSYKAKLVSHAQFLTHTLVFPGGRHLDIATARTETYPEPAALPVVEPASLQDDLYRRDFSINALALSLNSTDFGHLWDPFGGAEDLRAEQVRVLHANSFKDDPTRIFRAARFAGRFGYDLEWRTREWLSEAVAQQLPGRLSGARLREELIPILLEKDPRPALHLLCEWGVLSYLVPSLTCQKSHETLFGPLVKSPGKGDVVLPRLLALLHGVPLSKAVGALSHMMFPQALIGQIEQALEILTGLRGGGLDLKSIHGRRAMSPEVKKFLEKAISVKAIVPGAKQAEQWDRLQASSPCLSGEDLRHLGYKPGPQFKRMFNAIREARWEGKLRTREEEIRFLRHTFPQDGRA